MIGTYKYIKGITVTHKVGSNDDSEMVSQFSSSFPSREYNGLCERSELLQADIALIGRDIPQTLYR